jgi:hypothetical protein
MNTSLTKFCRDHDLPKSTVYRRAQELQIDTSEGLTPDACVQLLHEFDVLLGSSEGKYCATVTAVTNLLHGLRHSSSTLSKSQR